MSYCRFSSDNHRCDLYVYDDVNGGWTIHVANKRLAPDTHLPELQAPVEGHYDEWLAQSAARSAALRDAQFVPLTLPHAGETFHEETRRATLDRVRELRALGYHVPERVDQRLIEEMQEEGDVCTEDAGGDGAASQVGR